MLRTTIARTFRVNRIVTLRSYTEGATGSGITRPGGEAAGDAFTKREKANEDLYVRAQEKAKLLQLKEKLANQRKHLDELDAHMCVPRYRISKIENTKLTVAPLQRRTHPGTGWRAQLIPLSLGKQGKGF
ncbi:unnamed protein product [Tuber aestivum]|uniref:ATPase inhibitor, mitochondrial n=1 Tax=Tuber aestivum TaxID=59557 RepID=A0A292PZN7_9PEZI|nr:unnamed protein product [Tuber aestivum]